MTKKGGRSLKEEVDEVIKRFIEGIEILEETKNCDFNDVVCMMRRVYAVNALKELIERKFIFRSAFAVNDVEDAGVLKFYEDFIITLVNKLKELGVPIDERKWPRALAATSRYKNKLDGINVKDVRKEGDVKYI